MFISLPPPEPQRIAAVEQFQVCPRLELHCRIELATDVLDAVARTLDSSARSYSGNSGPVVVTPGTGHLTWTGFAPEVLIGPVGA